MPLYKVVMKPKSNKLYVKQIEYLVESTTKAGASTHARETLKNSTLWSVSSVSEVMAPKAATVKFQSGEGR